MSSSSGSAPAPSLYEAGKKVVDDIGDFITESVVGVEPTPHAGREPTEEEQEPTVRSFTNSEAEKQQEELVAASGPKHTTNEVEDPNAKTHTV